VDVDGDVDALLFQPQLGKQSRERDTKNHARFGPHPRAEKQKFDNGT